MCVKLLIYMCVRACVCVCVCVRARARVDAQNQITHLSGLSNESEKRSIQNLRFKEICCSVLVCHTEI